MYLLDNTLRPYAWGSEHAIADLLGREPSGGPEAELWVGAHPGAPSQVVLTDGSRRSLEELVAEDPDALLGTEVATRFERRLPFLLKVLAAGSALSLQVHPSLEQAAAGHDAEEAAGVPQDAPHRNYRDRNHKPEMIFALTPFEALCGFRPLHGARTAFAYLAGLVDPGSAARELLDSVTATLSAAEDARESTGAAESAGAGAQDTAAGRSEHRPGTGPAAAALQSALRLLLDTPAEIVEVISAAAATPQDAGADEARHEGAGTHEATRQDSRTEEVAHQDAATDDDAVEAGTLRTVSELAAQYPGDPGVLVALLLNRVLLHPGEALYLPAGNIHAYLGGLGIEVMASSDNVLRGGLTPKHVDTEELLRTVVFEPLAPPSLEPQYTLLDQELYRPPFEEFLLQRILLEDPAAGSAGRVTDGDTSPQGGEGEGEGTNSAGDGGLSAEESVTPAHCPVLQNGPVVVLAVSGPILLDTPKSTLLVPRGGSAFVAAAEAPLLVRPAADDDGATDGPVLAFAVTVGGDVPVL